MANTIMRMMLLLSAVMALTSAQANLASLSIGLDSAEQKTPGVVADLKDFVDNAQANSDVLAEIDEIGTQAKMNAINSAAVESEIEKTKALITELKSTIQAEKTEFLEKIGEYSTAIDNMNPDDFGAEEVREAGKELDKLKIKMEALKAKKAAGETKYKAEEKKLIDAAKVEAGNLRDIKRNVWMGGARSSSRGDGWSEFTLDRLDYDSAKPAFQKDTNTRFKALKSGFYRINFWTIQYSYACHCHAMFFVNGQAVTEHVHNLFTQYWWWNDNHVDVTWYIKAGQQFYLRLSSCRNGYRWHGTGQNDKNAYNRIFVEYMGETKDKCEGLACE